MNSIGKADINKTLIKYANSRLPDILSWHIRKEGASHYFANKLKLICLVVVLLIPFISSCTTIFSNKPDILIKKEFDGSETAVLNFDKQGDGLNFETGKIIADKLTDALFLSGKYKIIDRSKINNAQKELEIKSSENLSIDQIQQIGLKLKANYLILGRVYQTTKSEYVDFNEDKELLLNFRIISVLTSEVVGIVSYSWKYNKDFLNAIKEMTANIVEEMIIQ